MLVHQNTYLSHDIFGFPRLREGVWHRFCISAIKTIPSSSFGLEKQSLNGLGLRHTDRSNQVDKMGSDAIKEFVTELPLSSSYETAMEALSSLITRKRRGDKSNTCEGISSKYKKLERMLMYLKILSLEEHISTLKIIHVAGTKGKGSTCSFCEAILRECGFRTGLFTSPHLIDVRERFRIDGLDISENRFLHYFWDCWNQLKEKVTEDLPMPPLFQFLTLLAFKIFLSEKVNVAIVEVGLGGLKDSTNVIKEPIVCGITSLGMDHMEALGDTLGKIASHKAGIFKPLIPAFTVSQPLEAMDVLQQRASELLVPLGVAAPLDPKKLNGAELSLSGDHQFINAGLAVSLCRCWLRSTGNSKELHDEEDLSEAFLRGLSTARLSGRSEVVYDAPLKSFESSEMQENSSGDLVFYLDGAHTPESMEVCAKWFSQAIKESNNSNIFTAENGTVEESMVDNGSQQKQENFDVCTKISKQVLLFNCMEVRDPHTLLTQLVNTCASFGVNFSKTLFVPSMSTYNKVTSATFIPQDINSKDLSWQFTLQKVWEKIIHGNDVTLHVNSNMVNTGALPSRAFLYGDPSQRSNPGNKFYNCGEVVPTLPLTIKWLRDCVKENPSIRIQVLVTGSLHLIGDVLKLLRRG